MNQIRTACRRLFAHRRAGAWVIGVVLLGGCAASQPAVVVQEKPAPARWEAVVMPEATAAELGMPEGGWAWWDERNDGELSVRREGPLLASDDWPQPDRPSLDHWQYVILPSRAENVIYFRPAGVPRYYR